MWGSGDPHYSRSGDRRYKTGGQRYKAQWSERVFYHWNHCADDTSRDGFGEVRRVCGERVAPGTCAAD